jgi:hypothetical protein
MVDVFSLRDRRPVVAAPAEADPLPGPVPTGRVRAAVASAVGLATTALALIQLFAVRTVVLADNGDAQRLFCRLGLVIGPDSSQQGFESTYEAAETCPPGGGFQYRTSWSPVLRLTYWVERQVTGEPGMDIAVLGVVTAVLLGAGAAMLFLALPGRLSARWPLVALLVVAACDIGFVTYFNSGYTDQAGFVGLLWVCAGVVGLITRRTWPWLLLTAGAVLFTAVAKTALLTVVPAVGLALLLSRRHWAGRPAVGRWPVRRLGLVLVVAGVLLTGLVGQTARSQGYMLTTGNQYNLLFHTLLVESPDPEADLREMGLPTELARFAGTNAWETDTPWDDPDLVAFEDSLFSWGTYAEFFAAHPGRFLELVPESFDAVTEARVDYLANLPGEAGGDPPLAQRPSPVFWVLGLLPQGWPVPAIAFVWLGAAVLGVRWARSRDAGRAVRGVLAVLLASYAVSQSVVALSDGYYELAKHNVHAAFATGLLLAVLLEAGVRTAVPAVRRRRAGRTGLAEPPQEDDAVPVGSSPATAGDAR